jgi:hypothetical protein
MTDFEVMQRLQASNGLNEEMPQLLFSETCIVLLVGIDLLEHVTRISVLHDDAQAAGTVLKESLFETDYVRVIDRCQNADLVQGILLLLG